MAGWANEDIASELGKLKGHLSKEDKAYKKKLEKQQKIDDQRNIQKKNSDKRTGRK